MDGIEEKQNERCAGGGWNEMMESIKPRSQSTSEIIAFHKVKRKFLSLKAMEKEDPNEILICELKDFTRMQSKTPKQLNLVFAAIADNPRIVINIFFSIYLQSSGITSILNCCRLVR